MIKSRFILSAATLVVAGAFAYGFAAQRSGTISTSVSVGKAAPAFTGTDTNGKEHSLSDYKGKYVVLEWTNKDCPIVQSKYDPGTMQKLQKKYTEKGVVWIAVTSSGEGKTGFVTGAEANAHMKEVGASLTAYLLDPEGKIGHAYGAKCTPHMFVIDPKGTLIYNGAIDDHGDTNYVAKALDESMAGKPVTTPTTQPYGCGIKYGK